MSYNISPVSYTHLDVYKRQVYNIKKPKARIVVNFGNRENATVLRSKILGDFYEGNII